MNRYTWLPSIAGTALAAIAACTASRSPDADTTPDDPVVELPTTADDSAAPDIPADSPTADPPEVSTAPDTDDAVSDSDRELTETGPDASPLPPFQRTYRSAAEFAAPPGSRWARSIVHLHSTHSHDACDGEPRPDGAYNLSCLASLREALCDVRIDAAFLTDHPEHMVEVPFEDLLLFDPGAGDELVLGEAGSPVASWMACPDGHHVLVRAGAESLLMPIGLDSHVAEAIEQRQQTLGARSAEAAEAMRAHGALVWQPHTEIRTPEDLAEFELDGLEIYQLHANIAPNLRQQYLGLDPIGPIASILGALTGAATFPPDLSFLLFYSDNRPSLDRWAELLRHRQVTGTAGTDAHENTFPGRASDGERLDSYRRMMSWFSNYLLVDGELTVESAQRALASGRVVIGFDILGSIDGFDAAVEIDGDRNEVGTTTAWRSGASLRFRLPASIDTDSPPTLTAIVYRGNGAAWESVGAYSGPGEHTHAIGRAGIYRIEVRTDAADLRRYFGASLAPEAVDFPLILTNAWRLTPID